jgi:MoaA/NifB/PqqE/SkfB family radical SAM enzyme
MKKFEQKYCSSPWSIWGVKLYANYQRFCCKIEGMAPQDAEARMLKTQKEFLEGKEAEACKSCWDDEHSGGNSFRMLQNQTWDHTNRIYWLDYRQKNNLGNVEIIEIEFGDTCNLHCMSCNPYSSTTWQQLIQIFPNKGKDNPDLVEHSLDTLDKKIKLHAPTLKQINLYGGEPSIDPMFYRFTDYLLDTDILPKYCVISITTNGNYSDSYRARFEKTIAQLQEKNTVKLTYSIDAIGKEGEFIRGGLDLTKWLKNVKTMWASGVAMRVQASISLLNVEIYPDIYQWLHDNDLDGLHLELNKVSVPQDMNIYTLGSCLGDFLPKVWRSEQHKKYFEGFIGNQLETKIAPDKDQLKKFIQRLDDYAKMTPINEIPQYYQGLKSRLHALINEEPVLTK